MFVVDWVFDLIVVVEVFDVYVVSFGVGWGEVYVFSGFVFVVEKGELVYVRGFG